MHGGAERNQPFYRGADRRARLARRQPVQRVHLLALLVGGVVGALLIPLALLSFAPSHAGLRTQLALRNIWAILFLGAGVLQLVRWRATGETRTGVRGAGTLTLGLLTAPTTALAPLLYAPAGRTALEPLTRTLAVVACTALLTRAAQAPAVDTRARPLRLVALTTAAGWAFIALLVALAQTQHTVQAGSMHWAWLESALVLCWLLCGVATTRRALTDHDVSLLWMATGVWMMALAEALRAVAFAGPADLQYFATGVQLVVGSVVLANAAADLVVLLSAESSRMHQLAATVQDTVERLNADEQAESSRRHDARSVLASLKAASLVLDRYDSTLDEDARGLLLGSLNGELDRLERLIERRPDTPLQDFRLDAVLTSALSDARDAVVSWSLSGFSCRGRADELTAVVRSAVGTLARRSPQGLVRARAARSSAGVQLVLEADGGAGRDDDAANTLWLHMARRVMREQRGDIVLDQAWDGSTAIVFWLKAAPAATTPLCAAVETSQAGVADRELANPRARFDARTT